MVRRSPVLAKEPQTRGLAFSVRETLAWARELAAPGGESAPLPLSRLADLRRIAPRTLREHLARLEGLGLLTRVYAGQAGLSIRVAPVEPGTTTGRGPAAERVPPTESGSPMQSVNERVVDSVALLTRAGVYPQLARSLARKPWVTPELIAAWVHELRHIRAVRVLAAVLVHTLQDPERCLPPPAPPTASQRPLPDGRLRPARHLYALEDGRQPQDSDGEETEMNALPGGSTDADGLASPGEQDRPASSRLVREHADPAEQEGAGSTLASLPPPPLERVQLSRAPAQPGAYSSRNGEHAALWEAVHRALASRLPAEMDALWLRRARPLSLSDGVLIVAVPSTIGAEWLNLAGAPRARDAIQQAVGERMTLRFVPAGLREHPSD